MAFDATARETRFYTYSTLRDLRAGRKDEVTLGVASALSEFELNSPCATPRPHVTAAADRKFGD